MTEENEELTSRTEAEKAERNRAVKVHVTHVNEAERTRFDISIDATLQLVWDTAYEKLEISKTPQDIFQTAGEPRTSLMEHLTLTLREARRRGLVKRWRFEIVAETGGA